jgi:hypothetical protein
MKAQHLPCASFTRDFGPVLSACWWAALGDRDTERSQRTRNLLGIIPCELGEYQGIAVRERLVGLGVLVGELLCFASALLRF